ncbi:MAG: hypothetical protein J6X22_04720 [Muribaculaceae bacterium]|nr:hypothetical protein [Muribaculaceae bacterium]
MRLYTILAIALVVLSSCNSKPTGNVKTQEPVDSLVNIESVDSNEVHNEYFNDTLANWTDSEIVNNHHELVDVAQYVWLMNRHDTVPQNIDFLLKEVERINPKLVAYYDKHHKARGLNEEQKIDSVLNEIENVYEPMTSGSTWSIIGGQSVYLALDSYREALLFSRMLQKAQNEKLRAALREEMLKWRAFEHNLSLYFSGVARLYYWGGSISTPASLMAHQGVISSRIEDQKNLWAILFDKKVLKSGVNLSQTESNFMQSLKQPLDRVYSDDLSKDFEDYVEEYKGTQKLQSDIKNTLNQWLKARESLGLAANLQKNEFQWATEALLTKYSKDVITIATNP